MRARTIGRWVGRAAVYVALGVGIWAFAGLFNAGGVGTSGPVRHASVGDLSGQRAEVTTMEFDWN